ncbi:MAG: hypothetical protein Q9217_003295 [Psora testacea]
MLLSLLTLASLAASIVGLPSSTYVQHETRHVLPRGWQKADRMPAYEVLPIRIALTQGNLDKGYDHLMDVSHPDSPNFGKHWTAKQVAETFAPTQESVDAVMEWLRNSGISAERISRSQSLGWLQFDATVLEAENLLKTKYHLHRHETGKPHIGCDSYHIPEHLRPHVDFITPTVHFDTKIAQANEKRATASATAAAGIPVQSKAALEITDPYNGFNPKKGADIDIEALLDELEDCNTHITPNCLRALYRFPPGFTANPKNSYGIVEYTPQAYLQSDLDLFFANFSRRQVQRTPITNLINGAVVQTEVQSFAFNGESDLDLEYAMTLVNPQNVTLYQVGDLVQGASFNNFLDAIDGSYCTYEGGDDPLQDATYPSPFPGGYTGPANCGGFAATKVISTSYGYNEADLTAPYEARQCNEYMKLGLQGTTFFYSSGDFGVAGNGGQCISKNGSFNEGGSGMFNPSFPPTCPYVTAVGATQIRPGASVTEPEEACETVIFSGGGFSNVFGLPSYQSTAVTSWFANNSPPYSAAQFNNTQKSRGYPDISANGANYVVAVNGIFSLVYGTSASSPVLGSIFTLINEARFAVGKGSVGFINPTLYAHPEDLNDITVGGNQGCGTPGFSSAEGWDPVTGLGTPNFPKLLARFLSLP